MSELTTVVGWTAILTVAGAVYYLNTRKTPRGRQQNNRVDKRPGSAGSRQLSQSHAKTTDSGMSSRHEKATIDKKAKNRKKPKSKTSPPSSFDGTAVKKEVQFSGFDVDAHDSNDNDDDEFARNLARVQAGQVVPSKLQAASKRKSSKLSKLEKDITSGASAQSSDVGADDEQSFSEIASKSYVRSNDISDMLEAPQAGPSSLKISAPTKPSPQKKKVLTTGEPALTKTQKKNRQKNEQKAAENKAAEAERKAQLEAHRRAVRIAENRPAKDGTSFLAANVSKESGQGWSDVVSGVSESTNFVVDDTLLDTFDSSNHMHVAQSISPPGGKSDSNNSSSLSEEVEMARATQESLGKSWVNVPSRKSKKNNNNPTGNAHITTGIITKETTRQQPLHKAVESDDHINEE